MSTAVRGSTDVAVDVITTAEGLDALVGDWARLYADATVATPFQHPGWLASWWEVYGVPGALRLVTARREGELVGVLPLMAGDGGVWRWVGAGLSDHLDVIAHDDHHTEVLAAWAAWLADAPLSLLDLEAVRPDAHVWQLYGRWTGRKGNHLAMRCGELDARPWDELIADWSRNTRKAANSSLNRLERAGYRTVHVDAAEAGDAADELVALHRAAWTGRGIADAHADPRFGRFVRLVAQRLVPAGVAAVTRVAGPPDDDAIEWMNLMVVGHTYVGGWLSGENDRARDRLTLAIMDVHQANAIAVDRGVGVVTMLRGLEAGKQKVLERVRPNRRLLLSGGGWRGDLRWLGRSATPAAKAAATRWERGGGLGEQVVGGVRRLRDRVR